MADSGPGGRRRLGDRLEYEQAAAVPTTFPAHWTKPDVKGLLLAMQGRICAYCDIATNGLDVEHFRPKGAIQEDQAHAGYWWLAYESFNYFLGCTNCNRTRKKASFPLLPMAARCTYETRGTLSLEARLLLDPANDPVEEWLTIDWGDLSAKLIPNPILEVRERSRVQEAIDLFGLNLDAEVRSQRSKAYEEAARAAAEERWDDLRQMAMRHRPHSLAAKTILQTVAPERLPNPGEEVRDLLGSLWKDLRTLVGEIRDLRARGKAPGPVDERQLHALSWAVIVLRTYPTGDATTAESYLGELLERESAEIRAEIVALFRGLLPAANG